MKKIIDGFRFDTEKANKVCDIWEGNRGDFQHLDCALYCTKRAKKYFLAGYGGPMTVFSERFSDGSIGSVEKIIPLTEADAQKYISKYGKEE